MAQATTISLSKFLASVQSAVKAAVAKHPKFKVDTPNAISVSYLIRGFPVPDAILAAVTLEETQAFATEVATHIAGAQPELLARPAAAPTTEGAILSIGRHVIVGIPPAVQALQVEK
jgi:hypothetical protein